MTLQMILDKMDQLIRLGFVNARMPEKMRVKVTLRDTPGGPLVTDWLPVLSPRASGDMQFDLPDVGDQVLCLFLPYGLEQGFVIGSMYGKQVPPVQNADKWHRAFRDGTTLEYDRAEHTLTADIRGGAVIRSTGPLTLEAPIIYLRGTLVNTASDGSPGNAVISGGMQVLSGGLNVPEGDVIASGVSLTSHTTDGVEPGGGTSSHPTGGSPESPGTATKPVPAFGTAAYAAWTASRLLELDARVKELGNKTLELIACLPRIAVAEANKEKNKENFDLEQAWHILAEMFEKWLAGSPNEDAVKGGEPYFMSWNALMQQPRFARAYMDFTSGTPKAGESNIFNKAARDSLAKYLCKKGMMKKVENEVPFDFIGTRQNWKNWEEDYHTLYPVSEVLEPELDYLTITLGAFTLRALAKGHVKWKEGNVFTVHIDEIAVILWDSFNFHDDKKTLEYYAHKIIGLGDWRCEPPEMNRFFLPGGTRLDNSDFQKFRSETQHGSDFLVLTDPHPVEKFEATSYEYTCTK